MYVKTIKRVLFFLSLMAGTSHGASYYIDSVNGRDDHAGTSPETAWRTLKKASQPTYQEGDRILLKKGLVFKGCLLITGASGKAEAPVSIDTYGGDKPLPKIDSAGYIAGVLIKACEFVTVKNLEIVSDGGPAIDARAQTDRYGVWVDTSKRISINTLYLHTIFATIQTKSEGKDKTTAEGQGVYLTDSQHITIMACRIERVGRYGIRAKRSQTIHVFDNHTDQTGCSGLQMSRCAKILIRGNTFDHPGSYVDERMHGRGSGSWMWGCENVLYEKNTFLNAKGKSDSCGVHIDFNCKNVIIQHCFSMNNAGGFIEILGNNYNCAYRYNISVNDGFRKKGVDGGHQEGKILWLSGYQGKKPRSGPFNSYIYNNTVYVKADMRSCFSISPTTKGVLIANNIFYLLGPTFDVLGDQRKYRKKHGEKAIRSVVFTHNLYGRDSVIPPSLVIQDDHPIVGDPGFKKPGGLEPEDYTPSNAAIIQDKGIRITRIPGDDVGLVSGLAIDTDFSGNPITGPPDIGAIEVDKKIDSQIR